MNSYLESKGSRFILRPYSPEDEPEVLKVWKLSFFKEFPLDLWRWKYMDSPYGHKILLCVSETGTVAVMYSAIPYRANCMGQSIRIGQLMDIMAHPEYRGWLFSRTAKAYFESYGGGSSSNLTFTYGFPGEKHYMIGKRLLGYHRLLCDLTYLEAEVSNISKKSFAFGKVELTEKADNKFSNLWGRCKKVYPLSVIRNEEFVNWRFFRHPQKQYEVWGYYSLILNKMKGYAVLWNDPPKSYLVDILVNNNMNDINDMIYRFSGELRRKGIEKIVTWLPSNHFITHCLKQSGFSDTKEPTGIIPTIRFLDDTLDHNWLSRNLFYTMADADLF